jgi:hypothetical protein
MDLTESIAFSRKLFAFIISIILIVSWGAGAATGCCAMAIPHPNNNSNIRVSVNFLCKAGWFNIACKLRN